MNMDMIDDTNRDEAVLVVFTLADGLYGVEVDQVREITAMREVSPVPNSPDYVLGVTNLRGQVTTVTDLKSRLGSMSPGEPGTNQRIIVVESQDAPIGMVVDSVREVMRMPKGDIDPVPDIVNESDIEAKYTQGIGKLKNGELIVLLDVDKVLEEM
ncbi:MAG: chemotaxis protein CheW [Methanosarcinales archaeon]|nr:MAG: chemotaxis protein CheW [Methanosarcinales archaeon]